VFLGHFAIAFAAKRAAPTASLGTWVVACQLLDLLWPLFVLIGIETVAITPGITVFSPLDFTHYPWTHSLLMAAVWSCAMGALLYWRLRGNYIVATLVGLVVLSHWFLDVLVHRPDLPLAPGSDVKVGFGLWNSVAGTLIVEFALFALGVGLYLVGSRPRDRQGEYALWALVIFLVVAYVSASFGPPPPGVAVMAWITLLGGAITVAWAYWLDRHRETRA
jgi:membrane-bound metal-dependent hydrolase YbcI (DUF457 family)